MNWDSYNKRLTVYGTTTRERNVNRLKDTVMEHASSNPSCKTIRLNGVETLLTINSGTKSYYKEFVTLPEQKVVLGDYVEWANRIWLVYEVDADNEIYSKGKLYECNYVLRWQNDNNEIIERSAYVTSSSASNNGESENKIITLASNQFLAWMPLDEDTIELRNGKRMFIDNNFSNPYCYELTCPDNVTMKFGEKGCTYYIFTQTEFNPDTDKQVILPSGESVWIADYVEPIIPPEIIVDPTINFTAIITGSSELVVGRPKTYVVEFKDSNGNLINNVVFAWSVKSDFEAFITKTIIGKQIILQINTEDFIDEVFALRIIVGGKAISQLDIQVKGLF